MRQRVIAIDARELEGKPTGVGAYLKGVLDEIQLPNHFKIQLYFKNEIPRSLPAIDAEYIVLKSDSSNIAWQQWILCRELSRRKVDLLFSPGYTLPWRFEGIQVLNVHDLSFFRNPFWFKAKERITRQMNTAISIRSADRIYTDTDFVKFEICKRFEVSLEKIIVTPVGVVIRDFDPEKRRNLRSARRLSNRKVVLYTGSVFNRRHLPMLISAMSHLDPSFVLIVVGENRTFPYVDLFEEAKKAGVQDRVQILEYVSDNLLDDYYRMADVFVYLSEYEGFGIPPLEAMSYGVPVILSDTPAMNTIYKDAAYFVDVMTAPAVAQAIQLLFDNEAERIRLIDAGRAKAASFKWHSTAQIISSDWEQLLDAAGS